MEGLILTYGVDNEPYLGRNLLYHFDQTISSAMETITSHAQRTFSGQDEPMKQVCVELVPGTVSLALSIRELIRQAHLYGAFTLLRPLYERAVTILYLYENQEKTKIWLEGWEYKKRPKLLEMMKKLDKSKLLEGQTPLMQLNSAIHGDPTSANLAHFLTDEGDLKSSIGRNTTRPDLCDDICRYAIPLLVMTISVAAGVYSIEKRQPDANS